MTRACAQVVVLQPGHLGREGRQHGFVGNTIFLPQAKPSSVLKTLPPPEVDMQDAILFALVGSQKDAVKGSALLRAPRNEYAAAVECLRQTNPFFPEVTLGDGGDVLLEGCVLETAEDSALARELLQKGPADAQGQETPDFGIPVSCFKMHCERFAVGQTKIAVGVVSKYTICFLAIVCLTVGRRRSKAADQVSQLSPDRWVGKFLGFQEPVL